MKICAVVLLTVAASLAAGCAEFQAPYRTTATHSPSDRQAAGRISFDQLVERLEVLESLRERGLLTEREYQDAKKPLVELLANGKVIVSDEATPAAARGSTNHETASTAAAYSSIGPERLGQGQDH